MPDGLVARLADGVDRELLVGRLQLLQAGDVRLRRREPVEQHGQAAVDAVDVVGGDLHAGFLLASFAAQSRTTRAISTKTSSGARAGLLEDLVAVVGRVQEMERRAAPELLADRPQQVQIRQLVARPAQEEHRHRDVREVVGPLRLGLARQVEREGEEDQAANALERRFRGRRRGHAPAEGMAARQQGQVGGGLAVPPRPPSGSSPCRRPARLGPCRSPNRGSCSGTSRCRPRPADRRSTAAWRAACSCWRRGRGRADASRPRAGPAGRRPRPSPAWRGTSARGRRGACQASPSGPADG